MLPKVSGISPGRWISLKQGGVNLETWQPRNLQNHPPTVMQKTTCMSVMNICPSDLTETSFKKTSWMLQQDKRLKLSRLKLILETTHVFCLLEFDFFEFVSSSNLWGIFQVLSCLSLQIIRIEPQLLEV